MSDWAAYIGAVAALLAAPGPTNALMAAGGVKGLRRGLHLLVAVVGGYALGVVFWMLVLQQAAALHPAIPLLAKLTAAGLLLWSAWKLWRAAAASALMPDIGWKQVFFTTLLNPKALVFAFALIPPGPLPERAVFLAILCVLAALIGLAWMALGSALARHAAGRIGGRGIGRGTAAALALFAGALAVQALS